jgi:hypothetical protein
MINLPPNLITGDTVKITAKGLTFQKKAQVVAPEGDKIKVSFSPQWCGWYLPQDLQKIDSGNKVTTS